MSDIVRQIQKARGLGLVGPVGSVAPDPAVSRPIMILEPEEPDIRFPEAEPMPFLNIPKASMPRFPARPATPPVPDQPAEPPAQMYPHSWLREMERQDQSLMPMPYNSKFDAPAEFTGSIATNEHYGDPYYQDTWQSQQKARDPSQPQWSQFRRQYEKDKGITPPKKPLRKSVG